MGDKTFRTSGNIQADYGGPWAVGALYALPLFGLGIACYIPKVVKDHPGDPWMPGLSYFLVGICAVAFASVYLGYRNIRVSIIGDRILSTNILGQVRLDCSIQDVVPGSFNVTRRQPNSYSAPDTYEFGTADGTFSFDASMRNAAHLADRIKAISDGVAPQPHPTTAWTSDPLSEAEPGSIPLK